MHRRYACSASAVQAAQRGAHASSWHSHTWRPRQLPHGMQHAGDKRSAPQCGRCQRRHGRSLRTLPQAPPVSAPGGGRAAASGGRGPTTWRRRHLRAALQACPSPSLTARLLRLGTQQALQRSFRGLLDTGRLRHRRDSPKRKQCHRRSWPILRRTICQKDRTRISGAGCRGGACSAPEGMLPRAGSSHRTAAHPTQPCPPCRPGGGKLARSLAWPGRLRACCMLRHAPRGIAPTSAAPLGSVSWDLRCADHVIGCHRECRRLQQRRIPVCIPAGSAHVPTQRRCGGGASGLPVIERAGRRRAPRPPPCGARHGRGGPATALRQDLTTAWRSVTAVHGAGCPHSLQLLVAHACVQRRHRDLKLLAT